MSRPDEPKLRLVRGGSDALIDERFARRIGWQAIGEPALADNYEEQLAARIFGESPSRAIASCAVSLPVESMPERMPRPAMDAPIDEVREPRGWLLFVAAVALLVVGGAAVVSAPEGEAQWPSVGAPSPRLAPIEWPEREGDALDAPKARDDLPLRELPPLDLTAQPAPQAIPPNPGASARPVRVAFRAPERGATDGRLAAADDAGAVPPDADRAGAVVPAADRVGRVDRAATDAAPELARTDVISPDGEAPRPRADDMLVAIAPESSLPPIALPRGADEFALADPASTTEPPTLRDHLSADGHGDATMAVLDILGAGRQTPGRL